MDNKKKYFFGVLYPRTWIIGSGQCYSKYIYEREKRRKTIQKSKTNINLVVQAFANTPATPG